MLIIDMPMPKRCGACPCRHVEFNIDYVGVFCSLRDNEYVDDPAGRPSWCPIKGELVRCGECKYWAKEIIFTDNDGEKVSLCELKGVHFGESFFCADGERKEGED